MSVNGWFLYMKSERQALFYQKKFKNLAVANRGGKCLIDRRTCTLPEAKLEPANCWGTRDEEESSSYDQYLRNALLQKRLIVVFLQTQNPGFLETKGLFGNPPAPRIWRSTNSPALKFWTAARSAPWQSCGAEGLRTGTKFHCKVLP